MKRGGNKITNSGYGEQEFVKLNFFILGFRVKHSHLKPLRIFLFHEVVNKESEELAKEHCGGLNKTNITCM